MKTLGKTRSWAAVAFALAAGGAACSNGHEKTHGNDNDNNNDDNVETTVDRTGTRMGTATGPGSAMPAGAEVNGLAGGPTSTTSSGHGTPINAGNVAPGTDGARSQYAADARARLSRLDARLSELRGRADAKAAKLSVDLQTRRDELARQLDSAATQADAGWDKFKADVDRGFDELEAQLDDAVH